ncbi:MAG: hypothetical protein JWO65_440 [Sphingomonas bacterium]|nr:hypothetical protein [Sphingomonas bacterium]
MIALLAMLIAMPSAPGCHSLGASVRCELAAAVDIRPQPLPPVPPPPPVPKRTQPKPARHRRPVPAPHRVAQEGPPDAAAVANHIQSLVSIQDCTGAHTYAASIGQAALAEQTFAVCIGR